MAKEEKNTPVVGANGNSPEMDNASTESNDTQAQAPIESDGSFIFRGKHYRFADDAPQMILIGGEALSQEEIANDEELLLQLIGGHSPLINKLTN